MSDRPATVVGGAHVVVADEQDAVEIDVARWAQLAAAVLDHERVAGELTLTFVGLDDIAELNAEHLGVEGPTDVLSFPLDADDPDDADLATATAARSAAPSGAVPVLLGDVVVCPEYAAASAPTHAGTLDDELGLLVVHGVLHVLGHDHAEPEETARMRAAERSHLERLHWRGPAPPGFRQDHADA